MPSPSKRIRSSSPLDEEDSHRELSVAKDGSSSLELMLGGYTVETFFEEIWQQKPCVTKCTTNADIHEDTTSSCESKGYGLRDLLSMQWDILADLLERSRSLFHTLNDPASVHLNLNGIDPPLFFQDQSPLQYDVIQELYSSNPLSAYLDGCSIVINHADFIHDLFASLCQDLQRTFPHVYVNTYLTPPNSCAVSAHADDRDVFVIQLLGSKQWQVYQAPILFPYSEEQVGKGTLPVPREIITAQPLIETTLTPGDVLYMPRGFVHQAHTLSSDPSFHATIAVATHDWTLARTIPNVIQKTLESIPQFRMAMPLQLLRRQDASSTPMEDPHHHDVVQSFQTELNQAMQHIITNMNIHAMQQELSTKIHVHNNRANVLRLQFRAWWKEQCDLDSTSTLKQDDFRSRVVGPKAARHLKWESSIIRAATTEERSFVRDPLGSKPVGLTVREESREALISILGYFNTNTTKQVSVSHVRLLMSSETDTKTICDFTLLCFVKCCVELGSLAVV